MGGHDIRVLPIGYDHDRNGGVVGRFCVIGWLGVDLAMPSALVSLFTAKHVAHGGTDFFLSPVMYGLLIIALLDVTLDGTCAPNLLVSPSDKRSRLIRVFFLLVVGSVSQAEIAKHLEYGREFLAKGQLQDALSHYHAAVGRLNREFAPGLLKLLLDS